ncbi:MAG: polysaccharide deacetylase [Firmicutes bacterium]|nr:polysaccharide deacetylase [Bacillota bacterium]
MIQSAKALGLTVVMWDVDSRDWDLAAHPEQIVPNVMSHVRSGSIILLHERSQTVKVLPQLIKALRAAGYSFQALPA